LEEIKARTKKFALKIVRTFTVLPKTTEAQVIGKQFLRSGTSVGAHCHEGFRARSKNEFVAKIDLGIQELAETIYWLDLLVLAEILPAETIDKITHEANELMSILVTISKNTKSKS